MLDGQQGVSVWLKCPFCEGEHFAHIPTDTCILLPCTRQIGSIFCVNVDTLKCLACPGSTAELFQPAAIVEKS